MGEVRELRPGLWHWQAPHPEWKPAAPYPQRVSSYAIDDGARLLLFDPLAVPDDLLRLAPDREPLIVLTAPWHERDTRTLIERLGAAAVAPPADTAQDLMDKFGITAEQAGDGSPDLRWLRTSGADVTWYRPDDPLPGALQAYAGRERNDVVLWAPQSGAVIAGDTLADFGTGFGLNERRRGGVTREQVVAGLEPLLELPVEVVCPTHGAPTDRAALVRALTR
jgi:glyoxylase-like metal-dependent hydrolase (beta-lactamase superfamily II)